MTYLFKIVESIVNFCLKIVSNQVLRLKIEEILGLL